MLRLATIPALAAALSAQDALVRLDRVAGAIPNPTDIQNAADGSGRLFLVQQEGLVRILKDGVVLSTPFLDIRHKTSPGGERGLLGLAFPPDYSHRRHFYVNYTDTAGSTIVARYRTAADPDRTDPASEQILLSVPQPFPNHNGGQIRFGPRDGRLYIAFGDGGGAGDLLNSGQNRRTLLGKLLRVDVESDPGRILIPSDNPFVNDPSYLPEIWALGLRNPWRFSFDRATGDLWVADVGQNRAEEVNFQPASSPGGENYGWNLMEGLQCFTPGCDAAGLALPVLEYPRSEGCSITGGFVYRGRLSPGLRGNYLYGDFCSGRIWAIKREGSRWTNRLLPDTALSISTFGEDEAGEIYVADYNTGDIFRISGPKEPVLAAAGVVNAAGYQNGIVAGSAVSLFVSGVKDEAGVELAGQVPLPLSLGGVSVTMNGWPAPLFAVANGNGSEQLNVQTPWEIAGAAEATVVESRNGLAGAPVQVPVLPVQPGVFTLDGKDGIIVHHADNSLALPSNPLAPGEFAYFYATGLGAVDDAPATGDPGPRDPLARTPALPRVTLGGVPCEVLYSGLAPDFVAVYQINIRVPPTAPAGAADLVLTMNGASSPAVRVYVREAEAAGSLLRPAAAAR